MRTTSATVLVIGILAWILLSPMMLMHEDGHSVDCLVAMGGYSCLSTNGLLVHLQSVQDVLLAIPSQLTAGIVTLALLAFSLLAVFTGRLPGISSDARTDGVRLFERIGSVSLALSPLLAWRSRFQHSPTIS